jgi:hypothetical protein
MQHYGAPTRLLDWTASPYVAAYFAVSDHLDENGAIWAFHPATVVDALTAEIDSNQSFEEVLQGEQPPRNVALYISRRKSTREIAQQAHFTMSFAHTLEQEGAIAEANADVMSREPGRIWCQKMVIPKEQKPEFLDQLRRMNVTANSLFPGVDGLGRSLGDLARIAVSRLP